MTTDATGNVLKVPAFNQETATTEDEVLASYSGLTQKGLTLLKKTASTNEFDVLPAGAALKVSGTAKKYMWAAKADASSVVGILRKQVDITTEDKLANVVLAGRIKGAKVQYSDDTNGLSGAELITLAGALAGRYDAIHDMVIY